MADASLVLFVVQAVWDGKPNLCHDAVISN
jgi:hypothetical protein